VFENYRKTLPALFVSGFVAAAGSATPGRAVFRIANSIKPGKIFDHLIG